MGHIAVKNDIEWTFWRLNLVFRHDEGISQRLVCSRGVAPGERSGHRHAIVYFRRPE
jgi:hypothetical protein